MKNTVKFIVAFSLTFFYRLIPFRPANVEPLLATSMPFAKKYGVLVAALFGGLSIVLYDLATSFGSHTWPTAICYALITGASAWFFKNRELTRANMVAYTIPAILFYDFMTGPFLPSVMGHGNFTLLLIAQIPFTINHLVGSILFAIFLSPVINTYLVNNPLWEFDSPSLATDKKTAA